MWKRRVRHLEFSDRIRRVIISSRVLKVFRKYEQKSGEFEAGGILFGNVYDDHDSIIKITLPNQLDTREFNFFNISKIPAQLQINKSWKRSNGYLIYLGEWHTHSEINPQPSTIDIKMIKKTFRETEMEINHLYLIIVGIGNSLWVGRQDSKGLVKLNVKNEYVI